MLVPANIPAQLPDRLHRFQHQILTPTVDLLCSHGP